MTTFITLTVDTENLQTACLAGRCHTDTLDLHIGREPLGVTRILNECDRRGARATFFLNVYEHGAFPSIGTVGTEIVRRGHDVQLHTHPAWLFDRGRQYMSDYSLPEQVEILEAGIALMHDMGLPRPVAHRAAAYSVNGDTLRALRHAGIAVDCSMFAGHCNCKIPPRGNDAGVYDGVVELPVTAYRQEVWIKWPLGVQTLWRSRTRKTDVNGVSADDTLWCIREAQRTGLRVVNVFLHSYSCLQWDARFTSFSRNEKALRCFGRLLDAIVALPGARVVTVSDLWHRIQAEQLPLTDSHPLPLRRTTVDGTRRLFGAVRSRLGRLAWPGAALSSGKS